MRTAFPPALGSYPTQTRLNQAITSNAAMSQSCDRVARFAGDPFALGRASHRPEYPRHPQHALPENPSEDRQLPPKRQGKLVTSKRRGAGVRVVVVSARP
jgi:hypothetical protein